MKITTSRSGVPVRLCCLWQNNTDWTSVIVQSLLRQIELNTCIHRHLPLYDFSNIGLFYKSHWYKMKTTFVLFGGSLVIEATLSRLPESLDKRHEEFHHKCS